MTHALILGGVSYNIMIYVDAFPPPRPQTIFPRAFHETVGSTGAGKALNLVRLGMDVTLHAPIGDDTYGHLIRDYFKREGIDLLHEIDPLGTQRHANLMDAEGRRISVIYAPGSPHPTVDYDTINALIPGSDYILLNISNYCRHLIPIIKRHGKQIWCDIHDYDGVNTYYEGFIQAADYIFMSSDAMPDFRPFAQSMIDHGKKLVVCTHGKAGASALTPGSGWIEMPIIPSYEVVDTNGAGDAFMAGFIYGHSQNRTTEVCLRLGAIVSGLCVTSHELAFPEMSPALVEAEYTGHYER